MPAWVLGNFIVADGATSAGLDSRVLLVLQLQCERRVHNVLVFADTPLPTGENGVAPPLDQLAHANDEAVTGFALLKQQYFALTRKRFNHVRRDPKGLFTQVSARAETNTECAGVGALTDQPAFPRSWCYRRCSWPWRSPSPASSTSPR